MTWIVPLGTTIAAAIGLFLAYRRMPDYPSEIDGLSFLLTGAVAIIVSLAAWLVYAVVT